MITNEEAIEMLKSKMDGQTDTSYEWAETVRMAIKALEQEPCEDAISRKALIERINHAEENFKADNMESIASDDADPFIDGVLSGVFSIRQMVMQAQSVTPKGVTITDFADKCIECGREKVLDKIRAEIDDLTYYWCEVHPRNVIDDVLEIIDKHKTGSEG